VYQTQYELVGNCLKGVIMKELKHQWTIFRKGRMRVKACSCCGELQLPSNISKTCSSTNIMDSEIVKSGYQILGHGDANH